MKSGTRGFVGDRLAEARVARNLTAVALADLVGVTRQAIHYYETGKQTPSPQTLLRLSQVLNFPEAYFLREEEPPHPGSVIYFRTLSSTTKAARERAAMHLRWLSELTRWVNFHVELPSVDLPEFDLPTDPCRLSAEQIEAAATQLRRHWKMSDGPISNVLWLLENKGFPVTRMSVDANKLDGLSAWFDRPAVLLNEDQDTCARGRFSAAHELAHLVLHRHVSQSELNTAEIYRLMEMQAHHFAGAFLFPQNSFALEARPLSLDRFLELKPRWRLSVGMMAMRAKNLGYLSEDQRDRLLRRYTLNGWRQREPLDDELPVERPRMLMRALALLLDNKVLSPEDVIIKTGKSAQDLERLTGLSQRYFSGEEVEVIDLQPRLRGASSSTHPSGHIAEVKPLRRG